MHSFNCNRLIVLAFREDLLVFSQIEEKVDLDNFLQSFFFMLKLKNSQKR